MKSKTCLKDKPSFSILQRKRLEKMTTNSCVKCQIILSNGCGMILAFTQRLEEKTGDINKSHDAFDDCDEDDEEDD